MRCYRSMVLYLTPPELQRQIYLRVSFTCIMYLGFISLIMICDDAEVINARRHVLGNELKFADCGVVSTSGAIKMLQGSLAPSFAKTITHPMLQRNNRVVSSGWTFLSLGQEHSLVSDFDYIFLSKCSLAYKGCYALSTSSAQMIPSSFIDTHGHMLNSVISLTGPIGYTHSVAIKVYPPSGRHGAFRVFLSDGWREFVRENEFQEGDCVLFRLLETSCFHVLVSSKLQENAVFKTPLLSREFNTCDREGGLGKHRREDDGIIPQTKGPRPHRKVNSNQTTTVPICEFNSNPGETSNQPWRGIVGDTTRDEAVNVYPYRRALDCVEYPGFESAISLNSRCPKFISKLSKTNLGDHVHHLELPIRFAKEHGCKFQARVSLLGPCGLWRIVKLKVLSTARTPVRVQFRHGWKAFALENGFKEGDVLLFSLVGLSEFVVQVLDEA